MERILRPRMFVIAGFLAAVTAFAAGVWWYGYVAALGQLEQRARSDLALASDSLTGELRRFRELAVLTADHPQVRPVIAGDTPAEAFRPVLQEIADKTGALDILLVGAAGQPVASAGEIGVTDHAGRAYFERAMDGALGVAHLYSTSPGQRAFVFAAPVFSIQGPAIGALLVYTDVEQLEASWRGARPTVFFTDDLGVVFLSNRSELAFRSRSGEPIPGADDDQERLAPFASSERI